MAEARPDASSPIRQEFRRSPISTAFTVLGSVAGVGSLLVALSIGGFKLQVGITTSNQPMPLANHLLGLAAFLGITIVCAAIARATLRVSGLASFFLSIALASISMLLTRLVFFSLGIRFPVSPRAREMTDEFIYWGTVLVFVAITAERVVNTLVDWGEDEPRKESDRASDKAAISAIVCPLLFAIWALAVRGGQAILVTGNF